MEKCNPSNWAEEAQLTQLRSLYKGSLFLSWPAQASNSSFLRGPSSSSSSMEASAEARAIASSRSHSLAEKRRRERINTHLSTFRHLIPSASKLDKASLLGAVIAHVKDLKRKAFEISKVFTIPTEADEVTVECDNSDDNNNKESIIIRASMCCDDRPELFADLTKALHGLKLSTIRADIATLGGRVRNVLILCRKDSEEILSLTSLKDSIKAVLGRVALSRMSYSESFSNKRQRILPSSYF